MPPRTLAADAAPIDLLVIGGGTAGRQAALAAAEAGLAVHLVCAQTPGSPDGHGSDGPRVEEGVPLWFEHSALALLRDTTGRVCGARGVAGLDEAPWAQTARAVVLATGHAPVGLLLASEAGARLLPARADRDTDGAPDWHLATDDAAGDSGVPGLWITGAAAGAPRALGLLPPDSLAAQLLAARRTGLAAAAWIDAQPPLAASAVQQLPPAAAAPAVAAARARPASPVLDPQAARQTLAAVLGTLALARAGDRQALHRGRAQVDALWQFLHLAGEAPRGRQRSARDVLARVDLARRTLACQLDHAPAGAATITPATTSATTSASTLPPAAALRPAAPPPLRALQAFAR